MRSDVEIIALAPQAILPSEAFPVRSIRIKFRNRKTIAIPTLPHPAFHTHLTMLPPHGAWPSDSNGFDGSPER